MADYYPLLARALDAMPDRSPALRQAVYERARGALLGQLRSLDPPLSEDDIDLERNALEAAILRLEQEYAPPPPVPEAPPFVPSPANDVADRPEATPSYPEPAPPEPRPAEPTPAESGSPEPEPSAAELPEPGPPGRIPPPRICPRPPCRPWARKGLSAPRSRPG